MIISFSSVIGVVVILFGIRWVGLNTPHAAIEHPLNRVNFFIAAAGGGNEVAPQNTKAAFDYAASLSPDLWLEADLRLTKDRRWILFGNDYLDKLTNLKGRVDQTNWSDLKTAKILPDQNNQNTGSLSHPILTIEEFLDHYSDRKLILDLHAKAPGAAEILSQEIEKRKMGQQIIIYSRLPFNTDVMRPLNPLWLYGEPNTNLTKLNFLSAIGLETIASIKGDVVFVPVINDLMPRMRMRLAEEIQRRHRKIVLEGLSLKKIKEHPVFKKAFGFLTPRPTESFKSL